MNGRPLIAEALQCRAIPRPPWLPFVGVHGGRLAGVDATTYLKSADHIVAGLRAARTRYQPDALPVVFDLQMEAEVLGCPLVWAAEVPPSVAGHPLRTGKLVDLPHFGTDKGRFPIVAEAMQRIRPEFGDSVALYGLLTGPFTLAAHLRGHELFLDIVMQPAALHALMDYCADVACKTADFYLEHGADVIATVDPMTSQISPAHFEEFVTPYVNRVFDHARGRGAFTALFVCGDATRNIEAMCRTACHCVQVDENTALPELREVALAHGKAFGGNIHLTTVLLLGTPVHARIDTARCLDEGGGTGFVLAPGCDIPYGTPLENLEAVAPIVHDPYQREVARTLTASALEAGEVDLPDFDAPGRVYVDVITLDSKACPPCQYMLSAAVEAESRAAGYMRVREHKIKDPAAIAYMMKLKVEHIPTICIDGKPAYASVIPDVDSLARTVEERFRAKNPS